MSMTDQEMLARVQQAKKVVDEGRTRKARAEAAKEQAENALQALLSEHGVTTVEELTQKAQEARQGAVEMLAAAEAAIAAVG